MTQGYGRSCFLVPLSFLRMRESVGGAFSVILSGACPPKNLQTPMDSSVVVLPQNDNVFKIQTAK